jgi:hypothetical protein
MLAHGFTVAFLAGLVRGRLVTADLDASHVVWMQITDLGREALARQLRCAGLAPESVSPRRRCCPATCPGTQTTCRRRSSSAAGWDDDPRRSRAAERLAANATCAPSGNRIALVDGPSALRPRAPRDGILMRSSPGSRQSTRAVSYGSSHYERHQHKGRSGRAAPAWNQQRKKRFVPPNRSAAGQS